ncbi:MAG: DMT family transporter [Gemmobacter sp.]|jgi:drug/metabolite transporter (DMT)-like permease|nr:DMT family transporter [Gemmobacter sp.]
MNDERRNLAGIGLMLAAMAVMPFLDVVAKMLALQDMPVLEIVWARMAIGLLMTAPFAARAAGPRGLWPSQPGLHVLRAGFLIGATFCFFWSLKFLPIADALAIFFVQPLVVTALSPLVLGEHVGRRRWTAVAIGFLGTLVIIRPGFQEINPGMPLALVSGTSLALFMLITRRMAGQDHPMVITFHTSLIGAAAVSLVLWPFWQAPTAGQWLLFVALGFIATAGHYLIVMAYDRAEASLLAPLAYTEMIMSVVVGWWFFGDFPDIWTFAGVGVLIGCAIYISVREHRVRQTGPSQP